MSLENNPLASTENSKLNNFILVVKSRSKSSLTRSFRVILLMIAIVLVWTVFQTELYITKPLIFSSNRIKCVLAMQNGGREGLGAVILRNNLAFFIASIEKVPLAFPTPLQSNHGYKLSSFFSDCARLEKIPPECTLNHWNMALPRCPRGDCKCMSDQVNSHLTVARRSCNTIGVVPNTLYSMEFAGCNGNVMHRYFGNKTVPSVEYDAIHYRMGDMRKSPGLKSFSKRDLYCIVRAMCAVSERPIVIVTQGNPTVPHLGSCAKRIIMANSTSVEEAFRIFQHAKNVAIGTSSFALAMMELASPERVIVVQGTAGYYEWVNCEKWTIIGERCEAFHFDSKELMVDRAVRHPTMMTMAFRTAKEIPETQFGLKIPTRFWENEDVDKPRKKLGR